MYRSEFSLAYEDGKVELHVSPVAGEEHAVGRVVDYFTPTGQADKLQPAKPDEAGEIHRTLAPDVRPVQVGFILDTLGFTLAD